MNKRVLVAMSGGVDSSVAAVLLKEQGYDVVGITMQVWDYTECEIVDGAGTCCSSLDVDDARSVADRYDFPFYVMNCEAKFKAYVIDDFIHQYLEGRTPSPCVNCNTYLKFDHLIQKMRELDCSHLATGHYAAIKDDGEKRHIVVAEDDWKDQTYFLFTMRKEILSHLIFPLGGMTKDQVRDYAQKRGLINARKKDSVGICFVGGLGYSQFIANQVAPDLLVDGEICRYPSGEVIGKHSGIHNFTYGQRKGLGLDHHEILYVVKIDPKTSTVWVGDEKYLFASEMTLLKTSWLDEVGTGERLRFKIRAHHEGAWGEILENDAGKVVVRFEKPQRAVTPGQAAVAYRDQQLLGGGWIC